MLHSKAKHHCKSGKKDKKKWTSNSYENILAYDPTMAYVTLQNDARNTKEIQG